MNIEIHQEIVSLWHSKCEIITFKVWKSKSICNELIEETVRPKRLIFGMWEFFGYGSSKF